MVTNSMLVPEKGLGGNTTTDPHSLVPIRNEVVFDSRQYSPFLSKCFLIYAMEKIQEHFSRVVYPCSKSNLTANGMGCSRVVL